MSGFDLRQGQVRHQAALKWRKRLPHLRAHDVGEIEVRAVLAALGEAPGAE